MSAPPAAGTIRVFHGLLWVHYGQAYVLEPGEVADLAVSMRGQANGLCGAAVPGALVLITGLHTGQVQFAVDAADHRPPLDQAWEEVVEVSLTTTRSLSLVTWAGENAYPLGLPPGSYRVRYCASGMDRAHSHCEPVDDYLLTFWPAPESPDAVLKQTSQTAAYWHSAWKEAPCPGTD